MNRWKNFPAALKAIDQLWVEWVESKDDEQLTQKLHYHNKAGLPFDQSYDLLLQHIFNHSTYHNGQLVTMLRALGVQEYPRLILLPGHF